MYRGMNLSQGQKFAFFLTILVAIPVFAVGLFGLHALNSDLKTYRLEDRRIAETSLNALAEKVSQMLTEEAGSIRQEIETLNERGLWGLRCIIQASCLPNNDTRIDIVISHDDNGNQLYPPAEAAARLYTEDLAMRPVTPSLTTTLTHLAALPAAARANGIWSTYQAASGHHLLTCWQAADANTLCAGLNREWLIRKTVNVIDTALKANAAPGVTSQLRLRGIDGSTLWQFKPPVDITVKSDTAAQTGADVITRQLANPLYFWRLEVSRTAAPSAAYPLTILALVIPITALLLIIARALLQNQRAALAEAEERASFAASISHELRTPLTNLQLYADLILAKTPDLPAPQRDAITGYTKVIADESSRLSEMVDNALTIARNPEGEARQKTAAIPDHIILETLNRLSPLLDGHTGRISQNLNAETRVMIDRPALEQILVNLLDNARKYAPGARIRISSRLSGNRFTLTVRDWGTAFSSPDHKTLFSPFSRGRKSPLEKQHRHLQDGFGLGLAVCNQLCLANNGSIRAQEANPGARFIATLETSLAAPQTEKL